VKAFALANWLPWAGMAVAIGVLPATYISMLNYVGLSAIVCVGLVLLTGVVGIASFGQAAFVGLGAYSTAVLCTAFAWSPWATLPVALCATGSVALLLGWLTIRLAGHYLMLGTLAWGISLFYAFANIDGLGGYTGIGSIPSLSVFGHSLTDARDFSALIWAVVLLSMLFARNLLDSRVGRALRSLRAEVMAESFGVDTGRLKISIFVTAALLAGLSGWLMAHYVRHVTPSSVGVNASIDYLFMVVVGGASTPGGAFVGPLLLESTRTWLRGGLANWTGTSINLEMAVFGIAVIVVLQRAAGGVMASIARILPAPEPREIDKRAPRLRPRGKPEPGSKLLETVRVLKRFGGLVAVNEVSLEMHAGEILGLIGPNGAGKSTLFNLISGVSGLTSGEIHLLGQRIDLLPAFEIVKRGIARTFQHVVLRPEMTVLESVAFGAFQRTHANLPSAALKLDRAEERQIFHEAFRQLERVGLQHRAHDLAGSLALGQQRLLEIARALAADPVLLLLDEPAAGLRHEEKQELSCLLRQLRGEGMSVLIVEHDMEFVMNLVDRLVVVNFGEVISSGQPKRVQSDNKVVEAYLGADV
jgi:ABC-type branched-subunit amino acid transport system ATPase component/ABC-type branched-subunit amino acid transport system permease subunit